VLYAKFIVIVSAKMRIFTELVFLIIDISSANCFTYWVGNFCYYNYPL